MPSFRARGGRTQSCRSPSKTSWSAFTMSPAPNRPSHCATGCGPRYYGGTYESSSRRLGYHRRDRHAHCASPLSSPQKPKSVARSGVLRSGANPASPTNEGDTRPGELRPLQRMPWHQLIGMLPSRQRLDAVHPSADVGMVLGDVEAEFFRRIVDVARKRDVGDCRPRAK
jgi:hypothetical protein